MKTLNIPMNPKELIAIDHYPTIARERYEVANDEHPEWIDEWRFVLDPLIYSLPSLNDKAIKVGMYASLHLVPDEEDLANWLLDHIIWIQDHYIPTPAYGGVNG